MKVMIVDDEPDIQPLFEQRFRRELRAALISFHFAFSGHEAMQYLADKQSADLVLILTDINMPTMSGLELLRGIKKLRPEMEVIMITAYDDETKHRQAMEWGASDYLIKPIDFESLKQTILNHKQRPA